MLTPQFKYVWMRHLSNITTQGISNMHYCFESLQSAVFQQMLQSLPYRKTGSQFPNKCYSPCPIIRQDLFPNKCYSPCPIIRQDLSFCQKLSSQLFLSSQLRMVEKFHLTLRMSSVPCRLVQIRLTMWCCKTGLVTQDRSCIPGYLSPPWLMSSRISFTSYDVCLLKGLLKQRHVKDNFQVTWLAYFCFFSQSTANGG